MSIFRSHCIVSSGGEIVGAFLRGEAAKAVGDGLTEVGDGSRFGGAQRGLDRLSDAMDLVPRQIVHDHDVAWPQLGNERLFDIGEKGLAVRGAVEDYIGAAIRS